MSSIVRMTDLPHTAISLTSKYYDITSTEMMHFADCEVIEHVQEERVAQDLHMWVQA